MRATPAILAALLACAAAPAAAAGASVDPLGACYRSVDKQARESVPVAGHGFTPGAMVDVSVDGATPIEAQANEAGDVTGMVTAPYQRRGVRPFSITVTEQGLPENSATAQSRIAALTARLDPREATPSRRVRFLGRGFIDGPEVYGHYLRKGKLRKTVLLGAPEGPCGRLDATHRQIPVDHPKTGRWTLQIDNQQEYARRPAGVFVRLTITVKRVIGAR